MGWRRSVVSRIKSDLKRNRRMSAYAKKDRVINPTIYAEMKKIRICENCDKKFKGYPEIHHIIAKRDGGSNERNNLMAVCKPCHKKLDEEQDNATKNKETMS